MRIADYFYEIWLPGALLIGIVLGAIGILALLHWSGVDIWHSMVHRKSGLVLPGDHVVTTAPSLEDIQRLSGKA